jgi:hypothetical protein
MSVATKAADAGKRAASKAAQAGKGLVPDSAETAYSTGKTEYQLQRDLRSDNSGQANLAGLMIGLLIAAIIAIQVFIPVVNDAIASSNVSGTTKTILELLGLFAALLLLVALASPLMRRT